MITDYFFDLFYFHNSFVVAKPPPAPRDWWGPHPSHRRSTRAGRERRQGLEVAARWPCLGWAGTLAGWNPSETEWGGPMVEPRSDSQCLSLVGPELTIS